MPADRRVSTAIPHYCGHVSAAIFPIHGDQILMSAPIQQADIDRRSLRVGFGPIADIPGFCHILKAYGFDPQPIPVGSGYPKHFFRRLAVCAC
jgi:hypothetical protein